MSDPISAMTVIVTSRRSVRRLCQLSLAYLNRIEQREKRPARVVVEQPEGLAVPIAQ